MTEAELYALWHAAHSDYLADPSQDRLTNSVMAYAGWMAVFIDDSEKAREETERFRAGLVRARVLA
jgi:hypothetical protein